MTASIKVDSKKEIYSENVRATTIAQPASGSCRRLPITWLFVASTSNSREILTWYTGNPGPF
ncbi:uncharacterized protein EI90DRAFT_3161289 [Cantharellus anzutake]|uniref:uncharacterized protein n=1 Tax=Cantharellus anzutake TaxID=1750568 RepID=UPI0019046E0A|nr:uncharacterized protein EI90DRAFT_3161289 [Cantharellus anzutake]KAF8310352.1 hypothetical protein EI90DRAFT_3161289 [Cantharellus anzutake]